jgi:glycosyltransferase involved in cell wall biosynthesis
MLRKKTVAIDASPIQSMLQGRVSGIGRASYELVIALGSLEQDQLEFRLFTQRLRFQRLGASVPPWPRIHLPLPRWNVVQWTTRNVPVIETMCRCDLFHATANFAPIHRPESAVATIYDAMFLTFPEEHLGHAAEARQIVPFAKRCRALITPSQASKTDIVNHLQIAPDRIRVIPCGVRHDFFSAPVDREQVRRGLDSRYGIQRPFFLSVSCDIGRKNTPRLLETYLRLLDADPENDLVLVWKRPPSEILHLSEVARQKCRVHILQDVDDEGLRLLYQGATVMAFPSLYEGFGLPVLEAMACGTPVITTRSSSLPEVGGEAACYIDGEDEEQLSDALEMFENGAIDVRELSRKCVEQAMNFNWQKCARETMDVYQRAIETL